MRKAIELLCSHGLSIITGGLVGWVATLWFVDPASAQWNRVDLLSATGSILAGASTVGLLVFGFIEAKKWRARAEHNIHLDRIITSHNAFIQAYENFSDALVNSVITEWSKKVQ